MSRTAGDSNEISSRKLNIALKFLILLRRKKAAGIAFVCVTLNQEQTDSPHVCSAETLLCLLWVLLFPPPLSQTRFQFTESALTLLSDRLTSPTVTVPLRLDRSHWTRTLQCCNTHQEGATTGVWWGSWISPQAVPPRCPTFPDSPHCGCGSEPVRSRCIQCKLPGRSEWPGRWEMCHTPLRCHCTLMMIRCDC